MDKSRIDKKRHEKVSSGYSDPQTRILTVGETAGILRVHRSTVTRYAMSGELRSYTIGTRRLFRESDVWAFFENQVDRRCVFGKEEHDGHSHDPKTHP